MESLNSRGLSRKEPAHASECQNVHGVFVLLNKELELMSTLWWHRALDPVGKIGNSQFSSLPLTRASLRLNGAKGESHLWFSVSFFLVIYRQDVQTDGLCHNSGCWVRWQCLHPCHTAKAFSKARVFWHTIYLQRWIWKKLVMSQTLTLNMKPDGQSWCLALKFTCAVAIAGSESTVFLERLRFSDS